MYISFILSTIALSFIIINLSKKFQFLLDIKSENHKKFTSTQKNYSIGGTLLIIFFMLNYLNRMEYLNTLFYFLIFSIGLLSDLKILNSPKLRFLLQIFFLIFFIFLLDIKIFNTRVDIFDELLKNSVLNYFFVAFCLMIIINGSNFIDGLNTLLINYYLIIFGTLWGEGAWGFMVPYEALRSPPARICGGRCDLISTIRLHVLHQLRAPGNQCQTNTRHASS